MLCTSRTLFKDLVQGVISGEETLASDTDAQRHVHNQIAGFFHPEQPPPPAASHPLPVSSSAWGRGVEGRPLQGHRGSPVAPRYTQVRDRPGAEPWGGAPTRIRQAGASWDPPHSLHPPTQQPKGLKHARTLT